MPEALTTKELAERYRVTTQTMNRWIKKACSEEGISDSAFGSIDPKDRRIRRFSAKEVELVQKYIPDSYFNSEPCETPVEVVTENQIIHSQQDVAGRFDFSAIKPIDITVTHISVRELEAQSIEFDGTRTNGLRVLGDLLKQDLLNTVSQVAAENRHAVRGFAAKAVNDVAIGLSGEKKNQAHSA